MRRKGEYHLSYKTYVKTLLIVKSLNDIQLPSKTVDYRVNNGVLKLGEGGGIGSATVFDKL